MENKIDITVIIPVVELDSVGQDLFKKAVLSVRGYCDVIAVGSPAAIATLPTVAGCTTVINDGDTCYAAQVNLGARSIKTKWFSVLEYDDEFSPVWFDNVARYIANDVDNTFEYMPLTEVVDAKNGETISYANEAFWASSFSDEIGCVDMESLHNYLNFNPSGSIIRTEDFLSLGALKPSMKVSYWYEFLLRAIYKERRIYVVPKVGYFHKVNRDGNMTSQYLESMKPEEIDWWVELAKKEYFFPNDRNKTYEAEMSA